MINSEAKPWASARGQEFPIFRPGDFYRQKIYPASRTPHGALYRSVVFFQGHHPLADQCLV